MREVARTPVKPDLGGMPTQETLTVVRGNPGPDDVAALLAAFELLMARRADGQEGWADRSHLLRRALPTGSWTTATWSH
jgi:acyl-CoA carboxylase epsilon subunit-like protein